MQVEGYDRGQIHLESIECQDNNLGFIILKYRAVGDSDNKRNKVKEYFKEKKYES